MKREGWKISRESVDKLTTDNGISPSKYLEITDKDVLTLGKSLTDLMWEAYTEALKNEIRANVVMINKRLAKVNRFVLRLANGYGDFPPLICGLEGYVTDEIPEEFDFALVEAPMTQREAVFEDGRKTGYKEGASDVAREIFAEIDDALHDMAMEYRNAGHPEYFAVCEMVHHKVMRPIEKKYTEGEG